MLNSNIVWWVGERNGGQDNGWGGFLESCFSWQLRRVAGRLPARQNQQSDVCLSECQILSMQAHLFPFSVAVSYHRQVSVNTSSSVSLTTGGLVTSLGICAHLGHPQPTPIALPSHCFLSWDEHDQLGRVLESETEYIHPIRAARKNMDAQVKLNFRETIIFF